VRELEGRRVRGAHAAHERAAGVGRRRGVLEGDRDEAQAERAEEHRGDRQPRLPRRPAPQPPAPREHDRQPNDLRLGEQREREESHRGRELTPRGPGTPGRQRHDQGRHAQAEAQRVLALRDPGGGAHDERMDREEDPDDVPVSHAQPRRERAHEARPDRVQDEVVQARQPRLVREAALDPERGRRQREVVERSVAGPDAREAIEPPHEAR
jgi:hypothetical protein